MSESKITKQCHDYFQTLRRDHPDFYFQKFSDKFTSGIPDYYILFRGHSVWIELKDIDEKPGKLQLWTLKTLSKAGATTLWTDNFESVVDLVGGLVFEFPSLS